MRAVQTANPDILGVAPNDFGQFRDGSKQPVLWPEKYRNGKMIYPYAKD